MTGKKFLSGWICAAAVLMVSTGAFGKTPAAKPAGDGLKQYTVLTANVGNADIMCGSDYMFKLCKFDVVKKIGDSIKKISPDIVALQEVYDINMCDNKTAEKDKKKVCHDYKNRDPREQVRRLLGEEYTIVCDGRSNFECIGIKKGVGKADGCGVGEMCRGKGALTLPEPDGCEPYPVIFGVDARIGGNKMRIIDAHPAASKSECRTKDIEHLFRGVGGKKPLADPGLKVLAMGDLNMDPFLEPPDASARIWRDFVGGEKPFRYMCGPAEANPPYPTCAGRTLDHVISNFAIGDCMTLGRDKDNPRLDGTVGTANPQGTDHSPILCKLYFP